MRNLSALILVTSMAASLVPSLSSGWVIEVTQENVPSPKAQIYKVPSHLDFKIPNLTGFECRAYGGVDKNGKPLNTEKFLSCTEAGSKKEFTVITKCSKKMLEKTYVRLLYASPNHDEDEAYAIEVSCRL